MHIGLFVILIVFFILAQILYICQRRSESKFKKKLSNIRYYLFPNTALAEFKNKYPYLSYSQVCLVEKELKEYFCAASKTNKKKLIPNNKLCMPSKLVYELWLSFITTNDVAYMDFCLNNLGFYLPINTGVDAQKYQIKPFISSSLSLTWVTLRDLEFLVNQHDINELTPSIFSLDTRLGLIDGYHFNIEQFKQAHFVKYEYD